MSACPHNTAATSTTKGLRCRHEKLHVGISMAIHVVIWCYGCGRQWTADKSAWMGSGPVTMRPKGG